MLLKDKRYCDVDSVRAIPLAIIILITGSNKEFDAFKVQKGVRQLD